MSSPRHVHPAGLHLRGLDAEAGQVHLREHHGHIWPSPVSAVLLRRLDQFSPGYLAPGGPPVHRQPARLLPGPPQLQHQLLQVHGRRWLLLLLRAHSRAGVRRPRAAVGPTRGAVPRAHVPDRAWPGALHEHGHAHHAVHGSPRPGPCAAGADVHQIGGGPQQPVHRPRPDLQGSLHQRGDGPGPFSTCRALQSI